MPIYMIMPRYSHNYSIFYQLLDSNLFTHRNTYAILREATSATYGPRVYPLSYKFPIYFYLHLYFSNLYHKIPKIYLSYHIISIRSHFRKWPWRDWQPLYCVGCEVLVCLCRYDRLACNLLLDWYLGYPKLREILMLLCCITLSSSRKTNASSRHSKKDFWCRCRGGLLSSQDIPSTHHKLLSLALHYLPFASCFPLPYFTLAVLFALSLSILPLFLYSPLFACLLFVCLCVGFLACHDGSR